MWTPPHYAASCLPDLGNGYKTRPPSHPRSKEASRWIPIPLVLVESRRDMNAWIANNLSVPRITVPTVDDAGNIVSAPTSFGSRLISEPDDRPAGTNDPCLPVGPPCRLAIMIRRVSGRGGMETVIRSLSKAVAQVPHVTLEVWAYGLPERTEWLHGILYRTVDIDKGTGKRFQLKAKLPWYTRATVRFLNDAPVDALLATDPVFVAAAAQARRRKRRQKAPAIFSWLHFPLDALANVTYLRNADGHLVISDQIGHQIRALGQGAPVWLVHNPVPDPDGLLNYPPETTTLLYAGRLQNRQKRVDVLLDGLSRLLDREWRLIVAGDGPDRPALESLAERLHLAPRVTWLGWQTDPWTAAGRVTVLVLTSDYEGLPMVLLEALARGIPVIATDCPTGPREIVRPGENGLLVPPGSPEDLAQAITHVFAPHWVGLSPPAIKADVMTRFGPLTVLTRILNAINQVLRDPR